MTAPLTPKINRANRRSKEQEQSRIHEKLDKICIDFEKECQKLSNDPNEYDHLFMAYNSYFQRECDRLVHSIKHHGIHRGFFYMMYKREMLGVPRDEERKNNTIQRILKTPLNQNIAKVLSFD
jgi:hypothetical protein